MPSFNFITSRLRSYSNLHFSDIVNGTPEKETRNLPPLFEAKEFSERDLIEFIAINLLQVTFRIFKAASRWGRVSGVEIVAVELMFSQRTDFQYNVIFKEEKSHFPA